jgi:hypothetical protein
MQPYPMLKATAVLIVVAVAILGSIEAIGFWSCGQLPTESREAANTLETYQRHCSTGSMVFKFGSARIGEFIDTFHDDINALSTVVIAIFTMILGLFTISLARSTRIAADAANLSAKAAIALELPVIRAHAQSVGYGSMSAGQGKRSCVSINELFFSNLGRTKAFPLEVRIGCTIGHRLPNTPTYRFTKAFPFNAIWKPDSGGAEITLHEFDFDAPPEIYDLLRTDKVQLWFYCSLIYLDFMQARHEAGFCWRCRAQIGNTGTFFEDAAPAYNRKT